MIRKDRRRIIRRLPKQLWKNKDNKTQKSQRYMNNKHYKSNQIFDGAIKQPLTSYLNSPILDITNILYLLKVSALESHIATSKPETRDKNKKNNNSNSNSNNNFEHRSHLRDKSGLESNPLFIKLKEEYLHRLDSPSVLNDEKCDQIYVDLIKIEEEARIRGFEEIIDLTQLAIGKRLVHLELERSQRIKKKKQEDKKIMQNMYREHRIRDCNYEAIFKDKLAKNILIVKPYIAGGFNPFYLLFKLKKNQFYILEEPDKEVMDTQECSKTINGMDFDSVIYQKLKPALQYCDYNHTIREVNKIYFQDDNIKQKSAQERKKAIIKAVSSFFFIVPVLVVMIGILCSLYDFFSYLSYFHLGSAIVALVIHFILGILSFAKKPENKTELQIRIKNVQDYFNKLNAKNLANPKTKIKYIWECPDSFLYLQVKFQVNDILDSSNFNLGVTQEPLQNLVQNLNQSQSIAKTFLVRKSQTQGGGSAGASKTGENMSETAAKNGG